MLAILWGDDEHTARDGFYERALKARKWVILSGSVALLITFDQLDLLALNKLAKVLTLQPWLVHQAVLGALVYAAGQYLLVLSQLGVGYEVILKARMGLREVERDENVGKARLALKHHDYLVDQEITLDAGGHGRRALAAQVENARAAAQAAIADQVTARPSLYVLEVLIDAWRVLVPAIFGGYAFVALLRRFFL